MWQILRFDPGSVEGEVFGTGFSEAVAKEYVEILDRKFAGSGTIFFVEQIQTT